MDGSFFLTQWLYQAMSWVYQKLVVLFGASANASGHGGWVVVLTIFVFTLAIRAATSVGDISSRKSSIKMAAIQPELDKLQKKYQNDPQKLNMEQQKIMKANGVSMFGGCLPMLLMFPLLIMFFNAFRAWANEQMLALMLAIENGEGLTMFQGFKFLWITNIWRPDNLTAGGSLMNGSEFWSTFAVTNNIERFFYFQKNQAALQDILYKLHFYTVKINSLGQIEGYEFAKDAGAAFRVAYEGFVKPITDSIPKFYSMSNGFAILPVLAGATGFLQMWIMQKTQPQQANTQANSSMKMMNYMMPLISVFFCYRYDATFAFYWIFSNIIALGINLILNSVFQKDKRKTATEVKA